MPFFVCGPWDREFHSALFWTNTQYVKLAAKLPLCEGNVVMYLTAYIDACDDSCMCWSFVFSSACQKSCSFCVCYSTPKCAEVCTANQKDVLLRSPVPTSNENVLWDWFLPPPPMSGDSCAHTIFSHLHSDLITLSLSMPAPRARKLWYHHRWLDFCLRSPRWDWIMEYFMKSCLLPNNSLKFQHLPTYHPLSQIWGPPFPSLLYGREMEEKVKGSLSQVCSGGVQLGRALPCTNSLLGSAAVWVREKSNSDDSRLHAGVAEIMLFVHCENWWPGTDGSFSSPRESLESLHVFLGSQTSVLLAFL